MLRAGLIDEVSLLLALVADGRTRMAALFDVHDEPGAPQRLQLANVEERADDILWLRYRTPTTRAAEVANPTLFAVATWRSCCGGRDVIAIGTIGFNGCQERLNEFSDEESTSDRGDPSHGYDRYDTKGGCGRPGEDLRGRR